MITCYILDDEPHAIEILSKFIQQTPGLQLMGSSLNPLEALAFFRDNKYADITFVDVDMPQLSGIEYLNCLVTKPLWPL